MLLQNTLTYTQAINIKSQPSPTHKFANKSINLKRITQHLSIHPQNSIFPSFPLGMQPI